MTETIRMRENEGCGIRNCLRTRLLPLVYPYLFCLSRALFFVVNSLFEVYYFFHRKRVTKGTDDEILNWTVVETARKIREREIPCRSVLEAYISRIEQVNPQLNALVVRNFENAREIADQYDDLLDEIADDQKKLEELSRSRPLFGVPFTTKDAHQVKGLTCSIGIVWRKDIVCEQTMTAIQRIMDAGGILLGLSNVPESTKCWETTNYVYGSTNNPYDWRRNCAGSSGGEGALVCAQATGFGIGADGGGSIRLPGAYTGIFGLKGTGGVVPIDGILPAEDGEHRRLVTCVGPMVRKASDLASIFKVLVGDRVSELNFDAPVDVEKIRVFYMEELKSALFESLSLNQRNALHKALAHLKRKDRPVIRVDLPELHKGGFIYQAYLDMGNPQLGRMTACLTPDGSPINVIEELKKHLRGTSEHIITALMSAHHEQAGGVMFESKEKLMEDYHNLREQLLELLKDDGVLVMPSLPTQASFHNQTIPLFYDISYTCIINALGFPAVLIPMGIAHDNGLPTSIQIIAAPKCERLLTTLAEEFDETLGGWIPPR